MLTAKQIDKLPIGFHPQVKTRRISRKSTKYRNYLHSQLIEQIRPDGKIILRSQSFITNAILRGFKNVELKNNKWQSIKVN